MTEKKETVQNRIIYATLMLIGKQGATITTREIAKAAGVNSAAINYYFGSKNKLLNIALKQAIEGYFKDLNAIISKQKNIRSALHALLNYTLVGMLLYPGISKAYIHDIFIHSDYHNRFIKRLNNVLADLIDRFESSAPEDRKASLRYKIMQCMASVMFIGFFPGMFKDFIKFDFREPREQKSYISHLISHYFKE